MTPDPGSALRHRKRRHRYWKHAAPAHAQDRVAPPGDLPERLDRAHAQPGACKLGGAAHRHDFGDGRSRYEEMSEEHHDHLNQCYTN